MPLIHRPVMVQEVVDLLGAERGGLFVDATFGGGGHTAAILAAHPDNRVLALDRDAAALSQGHAVTAGGRAELVHADHNSLPQILHERGDLRPEGIVADLGISTLQLLDPARGFSFSRSGPLDMRMDPGSGGPTAADLVNTLPARELARILTTHGEERHARAVARAIVRRRNTEPFSITTDLAEVVRAAIPWRGPQPIDAATRTFQALRIAVNGEIEGLPRFVEAAATALAVAGRLVVISFHSLEDRAVKTTLRGLARRCVCPPAMPVCGCLRTDLVRILTQRPMRPSPQEVRQNPASRSARLRAAERLAA